MLNSGLDENEVTIVLLDDTGIAELNERDRGVEGPTDVLSYPTHE
ncbi:MAG TPA: rRNA maturation RNAse YbeY, partial [Trueperaceae bacterium]|nr:rRNA maturation RNAse YbeY [Trueperaceae bacterium]